MLLEVISTLDWVKGNRQRSLTYLLGFRRLKKSRLVGLGLGLTQILFAFLRPKMSVVDTAQLSQWCNQDSFDATYPVICENRYFSSHLQDPEAMPFVILAKNQPCFFLLFGYFHSKKYVSILNVLKLFSPILKKRKIEREPRYDVWHHRSSTCTKRQKAFWKTCDFGARKCRLHGNGRLKRRKKILKKKVW